MNKTSVCPPIIRTKLHSPPLPRDYVQRSRLQAHFNSTFSYPLSLITAAAGFGKSTLVRSWLNEITFRSAWITLDEYDNDLRTFLRYFVTAIRTAFPSFLIELSEMAESSHLPSLSTLSCLLINELDVLPASLVLVLDDIHNIHEESVLTLLETLLNYQPRNLFLVLVGRKDPFLPIARLRSQNKVYEIRAKDLQFTVTEAKTFLTNVLQIDIAEEIAQLWANITDGWITGLRLASIAVKDDGSRLPDPFRCWEARHLTTQYLIQEVFDHQTPAIRDYLLITSLVNRFCEPLCDLLCESLEPLDSVRMSGKEFISWLQSKGMFLVELDASQEWWRYHHLFQEFLREEIQSQYDSQFICALHQQIGSWFESHDLLLEAFEHIALGGNVEQLMEFLRSNVALMSCSDKWHILERWLPQLESNGLGEQPEVLLTKVVYHYNRLDYKLIPPLLDQIDELMTGEDEPHIFSAEVSMFRGFCLFFGGKFALSLPLLQDALNQIPTDDSFRGIAELLFALTCQILGQDMKQVTGVVNQWLYESQPIEPLRQTRLLMTKTLMHYIAADLDRAHKFIAPHREIAVLHDLKSQIAWCDYLEGMICLQRGEWHAAHHKLQAAAERKYSHYIRAATDVQLALPLVYQMLGEPRQADQALQTVVEFTHNLGQPFLVLAKACTARLALMQGKQETAIAWLENDIPPMMGEMLWWFESPILTWCRVLIAEGSSVRLNEVKQRLQSIAEMSKASHNIYQQIQVLILRAITYEKDGRRDKALILLKQALSLAEPGSIIFPFLEPGAQLTDLLANLIFEESRQTVLIQRLISLSNLEPKWHMQIQENNQQVDQLSCGSFESLTEREIEVLELLEKGLYQKEIAQKLFVTRETIKTHLKNIYQKLGVHNRWGAIECSRSLQLVTKTPVSHK